MIDTGKSVREVLFNDDPTEKGIRFSNWNYLTILEYFEAYKVVEYGF